MSHPTTTARSAPELLYRCGQDWTEDILRQAWDEIEIIAKEELKLTYYRPQVEIITARQMLDAYSSAGLPVFYKHWSFGKEFVFSEREYKRGNMGLAYEIVINSDPCIAYLMEENDANLQTMVMAHASVGHSAFFKNNCFFKENTDAGSIVDYLVFAKNYLKMCEEKYGENAVEEVLDACHALQNYGIDKYKRPKKLSTVQEERRALERFEQELQEYDPVWEKVGKKKPKLTLELEPDPDFFSEPQENILYFIEKNAPHLPGWKREIVRIVRKLAQYFHPQRQTKVINEGFATFCHFYIMNRLYEKGLIDNGSMIDFLAHHGNVILQRDFTQFNPYKLGFSIFMDIKRLCQGGEHVVKNQELRWVPVTDEDKHFFPNLIGKNWVEEVTYAMMNFKDETFILQYLSPKVIRDLRLFCFNDPGLHAEDFVVTEIANERDFYELRAKLAASYAIENVIPDIQVTSVDYKGSRKIILTHFIKRGRPLAIDDAKKVLTYVVDLWEYSAVLKTFEYNDDGEPVPNNLTALGKYTTKKLLDEG